MFEHLLQVIDMATAAPHSTRHKTMVVRSIVVHLTDENDYAGSFKSGDKFIGEKLFFNGRYVPKATIF